MRFVLLAALCLSVTALGCGSDQKPPPASPSGGTDTSVTTANTKPTNEKPGDNPNQSQINISDEIKKACGISDSDAFFAFDSANVREQDRRVLGQLAKCFSTGPLKNREMRLVGHADPRGEPENNMVLGGRRADNVKSFIVKEGLSDAKVSTTSRGEMDATGTEETSWSRDRRVDVMLGN
jgi:peptidoglycan-associated lipoprotein